jgi:hypothetical protein
MTSDTPAASTPATATDAAAHSFTGADIEEIVREKGWLAASESADPDSHVPLQDWFVHAAELLGPQASDREMLASLLGLVFRFDAAAALRERENQAVLAREGAREVIREVANRVLEGGEIDSDRFKEIVESMKQAIPYRSRAMFRPIRLALAGRAGEGELDRVILLLDAAAKLPFATPVKGTRQRILEFCAALD